MLKPQTCGREYSHLANTQRVLIRLVAAALIFSGSAWAYTITYEGASPDGELSALAEFTFSSGKLELTLLNTSPVTATNPGMLLTGVFFKLEAPVSLRPVSGELSSGSTFVGSQQSLPSHAVGANWGYDSHFQFAGGWWMGVGSAGMDVFGKGSFGCGGKGNPCNNVNGPNYSIVPSVFEPNHGVPPMKPAIRNGIVLTWEADAAPVITDVWFNFGTDLAEGGFYGKELTHAPEPGAIVLTALGLAGLAGIRRLRRRA